MKPIKVYGQLYKQALEAERKPTTEAYKDKDTSISEFERDYWGHIDGDEEYLKQVNLATSDS